MALFWALLWSVLPTMALFSGLDHCGFQERSSSQTASSLLESLQCYNDYATHVHCKWKRHSSAALQLWFKTKKSSELCVPLDAANAAEPESVHCRYETKLFAIAIHHTVFFLDNNTMTVCSSVPHQSAALSQHLRARPPVNLSSFEAGDGGQRLQWSSPYPPSSSLNKDLTYQLGYRTQAQDFWTVENVTTTSVTLERRLLLPGHRYEARVRAQASMGQWSDWSPVVIWQTKDDFGQVPTLHCILEGEREVMCSWEVNTELANIISYQLACRHKQTTPSARCCLNQTVSLGLTGTAVRYSCALTAEDPEDLQLELLPTHNAKTFKAHQHIRPNPPQQVKVKEKHNNWMVEWTSIEPASILRLSYQVYYYRTEDEGSAVMLNISEASTWATILGTSLSPLQEYQVKVRSLVVPGHGSRFEGIPSEWTDPVKWTSNKAIWSFPSMIYVLITVFVVTIFLTLYCTIPACQRKVMLWVDSVPSPGKSKILSEIKSASCQTLMQSEKTSYCKVQHLDSLSTCSSDALLWPSKGTEKKYLDQDEKWWKSDNLTSTVEKVDSNDTSCLSFSGPYIFCQVSPSTPRSVNVQTEERYQETSSDISVSPVPVPASLYGEGYVWLPSRAVLRSTQDLTFQSNESTSSQWCDSAEQDHDCPNSTSRPIQSEDQSSPSESTIQDQPPEYTSETFSPWPQMSTIEASGFAARLELGIFDQEHSKAPGVCIPLHKREEDERVVCNSCASHRKPAPSFPGDVVSRNESISTSVFGDYVVNSSGFFLDVPMEPQTLKNRVESPFHSFLKLPISVTAKFDKAELSKLHLMRHYCDGCYCRHDLENAEATVQLPIGSFFLALPPNALVTCLELGQA
ncbi:cytokine receptor common subunit beta [Leuresthes tenuis]|uniref:cytokine receptor common subunit beta n=1 Tax=Leuresthes tenuis TaxID=355514 RepID=UPI003B514862